MTWDDFDHWSPHSLRGAAAQLAASGLLPEAEADARVTQQLLEQLPFGVATPDHRLWTVRSTAPGAAPVGHLWMRVRPSGHEVEAFVLDVDVLPELRGRGWGRAAMLAGEQAAREAGASVVRLNVYAHNTAGVRLYEGLGYGVVGATLLRSLGGLPTPRPTGPVPQPSVDLRPVGPASEGSDPRRWEAFDGTTLVADVMLRVARRSDGRHAYVQELRLVDPGRLPDVAVAVEHAGRDLGARSLTVSVPGSLPAYPVLQVLQVLVERCGFRVAAQTMAKALPNHEGKGAGAGS
jgi:GNAT superfamily N-acetyltransferase